MSSYKACRFRQKDALQHLAQLLMGSVPLLLKLLLSLHYLSSLALLILLKSLPVCLLVTALDRASYSSPQAVLKLDIKA